MYICIYIYIYIYIYLFIHKSKKSQNIDWAFILTGRLNEPWAPNRSFTIL